MAVRFPDLVQAVMHRDTEMSTLMPTGCAALSPRLSAFELPNAFADGKAFHRGVDVQVQTEAEQASWTEATDPLRN